jgi:hypothetical protein
MMTPRPSERISTPRSIVLVDTILPSLAGQYLCATIRRRRPANAVVVSGPMTGLDLTQSMFEASNLDGSITSSLPQSRSSLILLYQGLEQLTKRLNDVILISTVNAPLSASITRFVR